MASLISQMRNGMPPQQQGQQQLNESIERTRAMMAQIKNAPNQQKALAQMLQANPNTGFIFNLLHNRGSLEGIARQMAQVEGIDIIQLINSLSR